MRDTPCIPPAADSDAPAVVIPLPSKTLWASLEIALKASEELAAKSADRWNFAAVPGNDTQKTVCVRGR